jgi:cytochrome c-type biogenesis protein CcmH
LWESLLAEMPPSALRSELVDRVAALKARAGGGPPDVSAMVAGLSARLQANPNDPEGWQRLVRAYAVLGDTEKAKAALADARKAMAKNPAALAALNEEAKANKLDQ